MNDLIKEAAQDPRCILAVTPENGGSWLSPLKIPQLSNFAENPMIWTSAQTAMEGLDVTQDYSIEIEFEYRPYTTTKMIFHYSTGYGLITAWIHSSGYVAVSTTLLKIEGSDLDYYTKSFLPSNFRENEQNTIKVGVSGTTVSFEINGVSSVSDASLVRTNTIDVAAYPMRTNIDRLYGIRILNDTTGNVVWEASYSELHAVYEPVLFTETHREWHAFHSVQAAADWTHDYTFQCTFQLNEHLNANGQVFYGSAAGGMFGIYLYPDRVGLFTNLLRAVSSSNNLYTVWMMNSQVAAALWEAPHTIRIVVQGNIANCYLDDELLYPNTFNTARTNKDEITFIIPRSRTGTIYECWVRDDTDNKIIWQASYADLHHKLAYVYPSPVPRDFKYELATWYDFFLDTSNPFRLEISFELGSPEDITSTRYIFGSGTVYPYPCRIAALKDPSEISNNAITCDVYNGTNTFRAFNLFGHYANFSGKHTVVFNYTGTDIQVFLDGTLKLSRESVLAPQLEFPRTEFGQNVQILYEPATGNSWRYPSETERWRFITKTNVRTDNGVFEGASADVLRKINTPLDMRGHSKSFTVIARAYIPSHPDDGRVYINNLLSQGMPNGGAAQYVFGLSVWEDHRAEYKGIRLYLVGSTETDTAQGSSWNINSSALDRWVVFAGVLDYKHSLVQGYIDGVLVGNMSRSLRPLGQGGGAVHSDTVSLMNDVALTIKSSHLEDYCLLFDAALTQEEITRYSKNINS